MHKYMFILGRNQELSIAEIKAVLKSDDFEIGLGFLVYSTKEEIDAIKLLDQLGGTIKIAKVFAEKIDEQEIIEQIIDNQNKQKVFFGFSVYGEDLDVKKLANNIKKELTDMEISSRWVTSNEKQLSSVTVKKNKLLRRGAEIIITKNHIAKTLVVQEFEQYSKRDFGRPARDTLSGTMPPKLAKIMINLAQVDHNAKILDPFCGSGTVLQEALLLGYQEVVGSDNSQKAIEDTKKNLEWLGKTGLLYYLDVRKLSKKINNVDAIISEPFLGPPLRGSESQEQIQAIISGLEKLYLDAFAEFKKVLNKNGKVVIVFPIFNNQLSLNIFSQIKKMGFEVTSPDDIIFSRPNQKVKRKIVVLKST